MNRARLTGPWAVVAAGCAAAVCLVGWPRPTLWALGIVVGAGALLAGLRGLLAEQRRAPAGPSRRHALAFNAVPGLHPETARPTPDTSAPQPADQAGDHPDTLRNRIATTIRHALQTRTAPALTDYTGRPISGTDIGLTEYDLADIALAEITADGYCPHCGRGDLAPTADDWAQQAQRADTAEAAVARGLAVAEVIDANGIRWAADSIRRALQPPAA